MPAVLRGDGWIWRPIRRCSAGCLIVLRGATLLDGTTMGVDATTLEANAALRSIVRRDSGTGYQESLQQLAPASGTGTAERDEPAKVDNGRPKKASNGEWSTHMTRMRESRR